MQGSPTRERSRRGEQRPRRLKLNLTLHPGQKEIGRHPARYKVVACGRQWGKTRLGVPYVFWKAAQGERWWWVAPDYKRATIGWRILKGIARQIPYLKIGEADRRIEFPNGGSAEVRSAHVEGQLRAETLHGVAIDEAAFMDEERWTRELRPTLAVHKGEALFLSSFNGENWFYGLYNFGLDPDLEDWMAWRHPSIDNPYIDEDEVEEARRTTPKAEFEQEWEANPLVYVGAVFDGETIVRAVDDGAGVAYRQDLETYAGLDWGYVNPTVLEINQEDASGRVSWFRERAWTQTRIETRIAAIVEECKMFNILAIYADAAGVDENASLAQVIEDAGLDTVLVTVPFNKYKAGGIKTRRWYLEQGMERINGEKCSDLVRTSKRYRYKENGEDVLKEDDHHVDAVTAFYASRRSIAIGDK